MKNRDIITKIIYKNSTDTSEGLLIKFEKIEIIIDDLDLHVVSYIKEQLIAFSELVSINDCDMYTQQEREKAVDNFLKGNL